MKGVKRKPTPEIRAEMDAMHKVIADTLAPLIGKGKLLALRIDGLLHLKGDGVIVVSDTIFVHAGALATMDELIQEHGIEQGAAVEFEPPKAN